MKRYYLELGGPSEPYGDPRRLDLFADGPGRVRGSDTSEEAADAIEPHAKRLCDKVLAEIKSRASFGMTCDEVELTLNLSHQTASARIRELVVLRKIKDSMRRRMTRSRRKARVYVPV